MKEDEIKFFKTMIRYGRQITDDGNIVGIMPRDIINFLSEYINHKRCWYLLQKWGRLGFYDWGVSLDLGWLEIDKLPERYVTILKEDIKLCQC